MRIFQKAKLSGSIGALGVAVALVLTACGSDSTGASESSDTASLLFTVTSDGSRIKATDDGGYLLLLDHVDNHSIWFTDRPDRESGILETGNFVNSWGAFGFDEVPPNAAIIAHDGAGLAETAIVTLSNPQYDTKNRVMMADISFVASAPKFTPAQRSEVDLGKLSVFIDDAVVQNTSSLDGHDDAGSSSGNWNFHSIIPSDQNDGYIAKTKLDSNQIQTGNNLIYSIPADDLIQNFQDHHLNTISNGIQLHGNTTVSSSR